MGLRYQLSDWLQVQSGVRRAIHVPHPGQQEVRRDHPRAVDRELREHLLPHRLGRRVVAVDLERPRQPCTETIK